MATGSGLTDKEMLITYVVGYQKHAEGAEYKRLQQALADGWKVVDIITAPLSPGGGGTSIGFVSITVLLDSPTAAGPSFYAPKRK